MGTLCTRLLSWSRGLPARCVRCPMIAPARTWRTGHSGRAEPSANEHLARSSQE
jgi:hypothetical protein